MREYFTVPKVKGGKPVKQGIPFKIAARDGVQVYVPKILVTGEFGAGKSSFVRSASKETSTYRMTTTIALDEGHIDYKGFSVDLLGIPGKDSFQPMLQLLGDETVGIIVIVDSAAPETLESTKKIVDISNSVGLPIVVAANKAGLKGAVSPSEIRKRMQLPQEIPLTPLTARDLSKVKQGSVCQLNAKDVKNVLDSLFSRIV